MHGMGIKLVISCLAAEHHSCQAITARCLITVSLATSLLEELCGIVCAHSCCLPPIMGQKPVTGICTVTVGPDWVSDLSLRPLSALNKGIAKPDQQQGAQVAIHLVVPVRGSTPAETKEQGLSTTFFCFSQFSFRKNVHYNVQLPS